MTRVDTVYSLRSVLGPGSTAILITKLLRTEDLCQQHSSLQSTLAYLSAIDSYLAGTDHIVELEGPTSTPSAPHQPVIVQHNRGV